MSNGRHFNPPTPAYRPRDPFSNFAPRSAERVPSCETTKPPPPRARPVRMDGSQSAPPPVPMSLKVDPATVRPGELSAEQQAEAGPDQAQAPQTKDQAPRKEAPAQPRQAAPAQAREQAPRKETPPAKAAPVKKDEAGQKPAQAVQAAPAAPAEAEAEDLAKDSRKARPKETAKKETARRASPARPAPGEDAPKAAPKAAPAATSTVASDAKDAPVLLTPAEDEEVRICEWEKCGKPFLVKQGARNVRRFCTGTCRGRASEARTGKR